MLILNYLLISDSYLGTFSIIIGIIILFFIALSNSNQDRINYYSSIIVSRSWEVLQTVSIKIQSTKEKFGRYKCVECKFPLKLGQESCSNCNAKINSCTICKLPIKEEQEITICTNCLYPAHENHWDQWIRMGKNCPICNT